MASEACKTKLKFLEKIPVHVIVICRTGLSGLFPVKSTNNIKIKITRHGGITNGCSWEVISIMNAC